MGKTSKKIMGTIMILIACACILAPMIWLAGVWITLAIVIGSVILTFLFVNGVEALLD